MRWCILRGENLPKQAVMLFDPESTMKTRIFKKIYKNCPCTKKVLVV